MSKSIKSLMSGLTFGSLAEDTSSLIPTGTYTTSIERIEEKVSAAGNTYLSIGHRLCDNNNHNNLWVFNTINIGHPKDSVRRQAEGALKTLLTSTGIPIGDGDSVMDAAYSAVGSMVDCVISQRAGNNGYGPTNVVSRYIAA